MKRANDRYMTDNDATDDQDDQLRWEWEMGEEEARDWLQGDQPRPEETEVT